MAERNEYVDMFRTIYIHIRIIVKRDERSPKALKSADIALSPQQPFRI